MAKILHSKLHQTGKQMSCPLPQHSIQCIITTQNFFVFIVTPDIVEFLYDQYYIVESIRPSFSLIKHFKRELIKLDGVGPVRGGSVINRLLITPSPLFLVCACNHGIFGQVPAKFYPSIFIEFICHSAVL